MAPIDKARVLYYRALMEADLSTKLNILDQIVYHCPYYVNVLVERAHILYAGLNDLPAALKDLETVCAIAPHNINVHMELAELLFMQYQQDLQTDSLDRAIQVLQPFKFTHENALKLLLDVYSMKHDPVLFSVLDEAIKLQPEKTNEHCYTKAFYYLCIGNIYNALQLCYQLVFGGESNMNDALPDDIIVTPGVQQESVLEEVHQLKIFAENIKSMMEKHTHVQQIIYQHLPPYEPAQIARLSKFKLERQAQKRDWSAFIDLVCFFSFVGTPAQSSMIDTSFELKEILRLHDEVWQELTSDFHVASIIAQDFYENREDSLLFQFSDALELQQYILQHY